MARLSAGELSDGRSRPWRAAEGEAADARTREFMRTALRLFAERDFASVRMQDIAAACGVNHSLLYYYFDGKKALFEAAVEALIEETRQAYEALAKRHPDDPMKLLDDWFDTNVRMAPALRLLSRVMFDYSGPRGRRMPIDGAIRKFYALERRIVREGIERGIELGHFAPLDARRLATFVSTHIDGIFFGTMMRSEATLAAEMAELRDMLAMLLGRKDWRSAARKARARRGRGLRRPRSI